MIVIGLIVAVLKKTIDLEANKASDLLALSGPMVMLVLGAWLIARSHGTSHESQGNGLK